MKNKLDDEASSEPGMSDVSGLRQRAEAQRKQQGGEEVLPQNETDLQRLVHEMKAHQTELEMQNEALVQARAETEAGLEHYTDLYDFAPVGYYRLDRGGVIKQVNLSATGRLGVTRALLVGKGFGSFIVKDFLPVFNAFLERVFTSSGKEACELELLGAGSTPFWVQIEAAATQDRKECRAVVVDIDARKQAEIKLQYLSMHDALTGLYNRGFFMETLQRIEPGRQYPISIMMADMDHLKKVNDQQGHAAGDELLKSAAQVMTAAFRAEDVIARFGGDEFAVLLPNTAAATAAAVLHRFYTILEEHNSTHPKNQLQLSCGMMTADRGDSLIETLKEADAAMYREKQTRHTPHLAQDYANELHEATELRKQAEMIQAQKPTAAPGSKAEEYLQRLVHELQVHQIELEMQNEELRRARDEVEAGLERYTELYDFAPVSYFSLNKAGKIEKLNLSAAHLLGSARALLLGKRFILFIEADDRDVFNHCLLNVFSSQEKQTCQVKLRQEGKQSLWVLIEGTAAANGEDECRLVVSEIVRTNSTEV